jgi:DNA polymerase III epsilon subunit-like protein
MARPSLAKYPISVASLLFFDLETTGLRPDRGARITELAVVDHATVRYDWKHKRGRTSVAEQLPILIDHLSRGVVVGHNLQFDFRFVAYEADRLGLPGPRLQYIDTLGLARRLLNESADFQLGMLLSHFGISLTSEVHTALGDAWATRALFWALVKHSGLRTLAEANVKPLSWTTF